MFPYLYPIAWSFHRSTIHAVFNFDPADQPVLVKPDDDYTQPGGMKRYSGASVVRLPASLPPDMALGAAIAERASCRRFSSRALTLAQLSTLLTSAYSVSMPPSPVERPVPSAGGRYPLEVYLFVWNVEGVVSGTYHYQPLQHALEHLGPVPERSKIPSLFLDQPYLADAGALIILTAVAERLLYRYGDRGYRYLLMEAGHVSQNLALVAAAVDVGCLSLGGFQDDALSALLNLQPDREIALYGIAIGARATRDRNEGRGLNAVG
ncbi:MAG TPA: SagB/ThcOx family dehydrogenase [Candidatus Angelobacter sp.]|jgi:SagB-type dehydrogenase family enzyme|nr:SagB/ThcOx family dehydrogenase [Candidatus Angelobacter sp.]